MGITLDLLVFEWVVEIDLTSVWLVDIGLVFDWVVVLVVVFVSGHQIDLVLVWGSELI